MEPIRRLLRGRGRDCVVDRLFVTLPLHVRRRHPLSLRVLFRFSAGLPGYFISLDALSLL